MDRQPHRPQALLHDLRVRSSPWPRCSAAWRPLARHAGLLPRLPGCGRRRPSAQRAVHPRRHLFSAKAQHGLRRLWHGRRPALQSSAPPSADGSSTTTAGAGSSSSTSPSACSPSTSPTASSKTRPTSPKSASARRASTTGASACSSSPSAPCRPCSTKARKTTGSAPASSPPALSSSAIGLVIFVWRELHVEHPILDLRLFAQRNVGTTHVRHVHGRRLALLLHRPHPPVPPGNHGLLRRAGRHGRLLRRNRAHVSLPRRRLPRAQIRSPLARRHGFRPSPPSASTA